MDELTLTDPRIVSAVRTCRAWPTQYEGQLTDGRTWYLRYRHSCLWFGAGADITEAVRVACDELAVYREFGRNGGGYLEHAEVDELMPSLLDELLGEGSYSPDLVTWLRQAIEDQHAQLVEIVKELAAEAATNDLSDVVLGDDVVLSALLAEVEAKRARIDLLAGELESAESDLTGDRADRIVADLMRRLLKLEAQPLASRPGFRDDWRLT